MILATSLAPGHTHEATAVSFMPDTRYLLSGGSDKTVRLWDIELGTEVWIFFGEGAIMSVAMVSSGCIAAGDSLGMLYMLGLRGNLIFGTAPMSNRTRDQSYPIGGAEVTRMDLRVGRVLVCRFPLSSGPSEPG